MKGFLLLLFCCLATAGASAQSALAPVLDDSALELARRVLMPVVGLYLLCQFVLAAVKLVLNFLLKKQIVTAATSESVVARLLPGPQDEQNKVMKWVALLLSSGAGLTVCLWFPPLGLHSLIILLFSTALGFLAYYLFLRRQAK
ncbi:hypothetical protein [Hymenobacter sp. B81]|uniref:hypothetical protein n=1 Tax=Hymenobacter sp. B81 TaxID=3344878 RepID=UPI0037DC5230